MPARVTAVVGSIVTVSVDITSNTYTMPPVTCPVANSQWIRDPIQIGDQGVLEPADASLGGISGLGTGTAGLNIVANLAAVVWKPVANATWEMDDPGKALINGPTGVILRDLNKLCVFELTPSGITLTIGGTLICTFSSAGLVLPASADVLVGTISLKSYLTTGVQSGDQLSGPPQG